MGSGKERNDIKINQLCPFFFLFCHTYSALILTSRRRAFIVLAIGQTTSRTKLRTTSPMILNLHGNDLMLAASDISDI